MRNSITVGQHEFIMRRTDSDGLESEEENKEALEDLTYITITRIYLLLTRRRLICWSRGGRLFQLLQYATGN